MEKVPVIVDDDFIIYTEDVQGLTFIHMDVLKWTKTVKHKFLTQWLQWASQQNKPLFAMPLIDNPKMDKWAIVCGFEVIKMHECLDGVTRKLFKWSN